MAAKSLSTLFEDMLKDVYFAERKILTALPKMAKAANSASLRDAFETHHGQTEGQVVRLEKIFAIMDQKPKGKTCPAIEGILEEGTDVIKDYGDTAAIDAGLIAAAQAVEHYEIARYGTLKRWAEMLGMDEAAELLDETLQEESQTDEDLTALADNDANNVARLAAE